MENNIDRSRKFNEPNAWLQGLTLWIINDKMAGVFGWDAGMCHGDGVQSSIIVPPILIPVHIFTQGMSHRMINKKTG